MKRPTTTRRLLMGCGEGLTGHAVLRQRHAPKVSRGQTVRDMQTGVTKGKR